MPVITMTLDDTTTTVDVEFNYRPWIPGSDPWTALSRGIVPADSGTFDYDRIATIGSFQVFSVPLGGSTKKWTMTLRNIPTSGSSLNLKVGDSGDGMFASLPAKVLNDPFQWICKSIR